MAYNNTKNTNSTNNSTQKYTNVENQLLQEYPQLPKNPTVKIIECPLSQSTSKTTDNGAWINSFKEPIFIPKGSEVRVQSCFIESRGINQEILVFDGLNDLSSRNDNITHLYSFYVNNTGFNDMLLEYDIKDRATTTSSGATRTPKGDQGHNYKKAQLQKYCNSLMRDTHFCGGANFHKRIITTNIGQSFQIPLNRLTLRPNLEALYRIGYREDPFVSGRFFQPPSKTIQINGNATRCFYYTGFNGGEMLFMFLGTDVGYIIIDLGYEDIDYQQFVSPQNIGDTGKLVSKKEVHYATNHFQYGEIIKISHSAKLKYPSTGKNLNNIDPLRNFNRQYGGYFKVGYRFDLTKGYDSPVLDTIYDKVITYLTTNNPQLIPRFKAHPYMLTQTENIFLEDQGKNPYFFQANQPIDTIDSSINLRNNIETNAEFVSLTTTGTSFTEIAPTPFYPITEQNSIEPKGFNLNSDTYGFIKNDNGTHLRDTAKLYTPTSGNNTFKLYQVISNTNNRIQKKIDSIDDATIQPDDSISGTIYEDGTTELTYVSGGASMGFHQFTNITAGSTAEEFTITGTSTDFGTSDLCLYIGYNDICIFNKGLANEEHCLIYGLSSSLPTYTLNVKRDFDGQLAPNSSTTIHTIDFYVNQIILNKTFTGNYDLAGIGTTELSKYTGLTLDSADATLVDAPYTFSYNNFDNDNGINMNKPNCFFGRNDSNLDFYNENFPELINHLASYQTATNSILLDDYGQGGMFYVSSRSDASTAQIPNMGDCYFTTDALFPSNHPTDYLAGRQTKFDSNMIFNVFSDNSHLEYDYYDHFQTFSYQVPKAYMSPSDLGSDYTNKTHIAKGIINYYNGLRYADTDKLGIFQNEFCIPVAGSNFSDNTYDTVPTSPYFGKMKPSTQTNLQFEPNSFRGKIQVDSNLLHSDTTNPDGEYLMYFRNQHNYTRIYDPLDPTRTPFPPLAHTGINNSKFFDGATTSATPNTASFTEEAFPTTTSNYPVIYAITNTDPIGNNNVESHRISQFAGSSNGITLAYNNSLSLFEFSFLHTPFTTNYDTNEESGGDIAVKINYPSIQGVGNIESCSGIKMINWAKPNYVVGMFRASEIDTFQPAPYPNGLGITKFDSVGQRFMNKLGFSDEVIKRNQDITITNDVGITGSDVDVSSSIIQSKQATENVPNIDSNVYAIPSSGIPSGFEKMNGYVGKGLGDKIFYPYGVDTTSGALSKDLTVIRYDFATQRFATKGGLRISGHNTGMGLPNTTGSYTFCDGSTFPISFNPDYSKYEGYTIACGSSAIRADNLPVKFDNGYFMLQSSLADNNANYYLGKEGQGLNILSTVLKTYISGDFIISFNSPYAFYTKEDQYVGYVESKIINSNGDIPPNLGENSSVIYQITDYNPRDSMEQPTTDEIQDQEYNMIEMMEKFQGQGQGVRKPNDITQLQNDIGDLANIVVNPAVGGNNSDVIENLRERITDMDIPNMNFEQRRAFFTQTEMGQKMYNQLLAINEMSSVAQGLQEPFNMPEIVRQSLLDRLRNARQTIHNNSGFKLLKQELQEGVPETGAYDEIPSAETFFSRKAEQYQKSKDEGGAIIKTKKLPSGRKLKTMIKPTQQQVESLESTAVHPAIQQKKKESESGVGTSLATSETEASSSFSQETYYPTE